MKTNIYIPFNSHAAILIFPIVLLETPLATSTMHQLTQCMVSFIDAPNQTPVKKIKYSIESYIVNSKIIRKGNKDRIQMREQLL